MTDEKELQIEITGQGVKFSSKGDASDRVVHSFADLLSPFSNGFGILGDVIRYYRQDMAIRAIDRSRKLASELAISIQPVEPKFLVDWVEKASLEDPKDDEIVELWARLLLSASVDLKPIHYHAKRIISEISKRHLEFLSLLCDYDFSSKNPFRPEEDLSALTDFLAMKQGPKPVSDFKIDIVDRVIGFECNTFKFKKIDVFKRIGPMNYNDLFISHSSEIFLQYISDYTVKYLLDVGVIEEIIVDLYAKYNQDSRDYKVVLHGYILTDFGTDFLSSCIPVERGLRQT